MMTDLVEKSLDTMLGHAESTMEEASNNLLSATISTTNTMDEFWEECQRFTADLKETMEEAVEIIKEAPERQINERREKIPEMLEEGMYTDWMRRNMVLLPPVQAAVIA